MVGSAASDAADDARERDAAGDPTDAGDRDARDDAGDASNAAGGGAPAGNEANKPFAGFSVVASRRASSTRARNRFSCVFKASKRSFA